MDHKNNHQEHQGNALNGFTIGVVVGVALTLLLTTKKGRRILKMLTDQGMDQIEKWEQTIKTKTEPVVEDIVDEVDEIMEGHDYMAAEEIKTTTEPPHVSEHAVKHSLKAEDPLAESRSTNHRRFFRGAKKSLTT